MNKNRINNTKKNILSGIVNKIIVMIFPFIIRTVILYHLSEEYLGLSSLFTSILQVLNIAELGFSHAIVYNMYKPIADKNYDLVGAYLNYFKKIYLRVGLIIFGFGIVILPFLKFLISGTYPEEINLYILYILYLIDSASSYLWFAYKGCLLNALQKVNILTNIQSVIWILKYSIQILIIILFKNYYLFVIVSIISTIVINLMTSKYVDNNLPEYKNDIELSSKKKEELKTQVKGVMLGRISDVFRNSLDSIILSTFFGLTTVAIYNNYYYIFSAIYAIILIITHAMQASVGNSIAKESVVKNYNDLKKFNFLFTYIICFCCICLISLFQPFMRIWVGRNLMFSDFNMILLCLYFFVLNINNIRNLYFTGNGLWWDAKESFILEAIGNLLLNILLGTIFGTVGIIIATIITIFIFNYILRTNILFKKYFKIKPYEYYFKMFLYFCVIFILCSVSYVFCNKLLIIDGIIGLIVYLTISFFISLFFIVIFSKTREYDDSKILIKKVLKKQ